MYQFFRLQCPAVPRRLSLRPSAPSPGDTPCSPLTPGAAPGMPMQDLPYPTSRRKRQSTTGLTPLPFPSSTGTSWPRSPARPGDASPPPAAPAARGSRSHMPPQQPNNPSACNTAQFCLCNHNPFPFFPSVSFRHPGKGRERKQELTPSSALARECLCPALQRCPFRV